MAAHRRRRARHRDGVPGPALRPIAWSALFSAALATTVATPVYAAPVRPYTAPTDAAGVPDSGSRPAPTGQLRLPGSGSTAGIPATTIATTPGVNALAAQVEAKRVAVALSGEQLLRIREEQQQVKAQVTLADSRLSTAREALTRAQQEADAAAAEALKDAAALPPGAFGSDLHGLGTLSRIQRDESPSQEAAARQLAVAQDAQRAAEADHAAAVSREQALVTQYTAVDTARQRDEAALRQLQQQNSGALTAYDRTREAEDRRIGAGYLSNPTTAGQSADPRALAALRYALAQIGDQYVWSEEGPDQFDCSGLMFAAYRTYAAQPYPLPRVARDQYYATRQRQVDRASLLPGDLVFFSSSSSWTGIHHVGMYVGDGKMVHAPNSNELVQVSTVWWSRFFAATRVFGAVTGPAAPVPTVPQPTKPTPTRPTPPRPTPSPQPKPTPPKPGTPSTPPSTPPTSAVPSATASTSPSPSASASPSPSPSPSVSGVNGQETSTEPSTGPSSADGE